MSDRLAYFANNAPPVPEWFKPDLDLPPRKFAPMQEKFGVERTREYFNIRSGKPIPEHLIELRDHWLARCAEAKIYDLKIQEMTYLAWRKFYAQKMAEMLSDVEL